MHNLMLIFYPTIYFMQINNIFLYQQFLTIIQHIFIQHFYTILYHSRSKFTPTKKFTFNV
jgi:hypothetical protein